MHQMLLTAICFLAVATPRFTLAQVTISSEIAPMGKLRVAMNASTPVLLTRSRDGKVVGGVADEVGKFIAQKLGLPFELVAYVGSTAYTQSFGKGEWDLGFGARTPLVADKADFILDVVLTDYVFVAAPGRKFVDVASVDRPGVKIAVGENSSSEQFLRRTVKSAELVRIPSGAGGIDVLRGGKADVYAASASNVGQVIEALAGATLVPGAFNSDRYMVTLPKGKSSAAQAKIAEIVREAKKAGLVQKAIDKLALKGVRTAPD